ncbi:helix-turn-helix domain-containing protein [Candidatus Protochlamydia amoebophila]|uniref:Antitoxin igA-2 n=1 Tax=Candidatus Protochlamydia amoebophila TaxID=362787 RepID=A0A0C1GZU3_9BACT|nr:helix-turn-helix domain-containing protein [Candidatus Protochlamydia amoebophila]KIC71069.1 Antitoxin igA-2 [Candidatus Protochlamydia amoebophila]
MSEMFELLKEGLNDIVEHQKGKNKLKKRNINIPEPANMYSAQDVKRIRESLNYSQNLFARFLNISIRTVEAWETGRRTPNHAALRLLEIVDKGIYHP